MGISTGIAWTNHTFQYRLGLRQGFARLQILLCRRAGRACRLERLGAEPATPHVQRQALAGAAQMAKGGRTGRHAAPSILLVHVRQLRRSPHDYRGAGQALAADSRDAEPRLATTHQARR